MNNLNLETDKMDDILRLKFNEMMLKFLTIQRKHKLNVDGVDFSAAEIHLVDTIGRHPNANVTEMARYQGVTKSAISQKLRKLENKGIILRSRDALNAKEVNVELTKAGWRAFNLHEEHHRAQDSEMFEFLEKASPENIRFLIEGFEMMNSVMDKYIDQDSTELG